MRLARAITAFGFFLLYVPLVLLVWFSFRDPAAGFTLSWYRKVLSDEQVLRSFETSVQVAACCTVISTLIGTAAALVVVRTRFPGRRLLDGFAHLPLVMPEIVVGLSLLVWFAALHLTLGTFSIVLAHVTFSVSYVLITVKARLQDFDESLEEAARDLGATPWQTFHRVTLPLVWPGILSGALLAFTLSFDDFLITFFTAGVGSDTLPLKIYAMVRFGVSPEINALSTLLLAATLLLVLTVFGRPQGTGRPRTH